MVLKKVSFFNIASHSGIYRYGSERPVPN